MQYRIGSLIGTFLVALLAFSACDKDTSTNLDGNGSGDTGTLAIRLTDSPADVQEVWITFSQISAHIDSQWVTVTDTPRTVNLLEWNNGSSVLLGTAELPAGRYSQIRLKIIDADIMVDSVMWDMDVPSGATSGLKLLAHFDLDPGAFYELVLDFDVHRSIVRMGPPHNPHGYKLKPTIRVTARAATGAISGRVLNPEALPLAWALVPPDTVTGSLIMADSTFQLAFLPDGIYDVAVEDTLGRRFDTTGVVVVPGVVNDLGDIELQ